MAFKKSKIHVLVSIQLFIGFGAFAGGLGFVMDPTGAILGFLIEWLEASLFTTYLMPGLILLLVLGVGNLIGGVFTLLEKRKSGILASFLGFYLMLWITAQMLLFPFHWIQPAFLLLGYIEVLLGIAVYLDGSSHHVPESSTHFV